MMQFQKPLVLTKTTTMTTSTGRLNRYTIHLDKNMRLHNCVNDNVRDHAGVSINITYVDDKRSCVTDVGVAPFRGTIPLSTSTIDYTYPYMYVSAVTPSRREFSKRTFIVKCTVT